VTLAPVALLLGALLGSDGPRADDHLLAGANAFREERYDVALVEFRVAQALGAPDAEAYVATTLVKLNRPEEAVEAYGHGGGEGADALIDYYRGLACYGSRLYQCADRLMAAVGDRAGPKIAGIASDLRAKIAGALAVEPLRETIDWYLSRCAAERKGRRTALAAEYCREAAGLSRRRSDRYGLSQAEAGPRG
jgi:hypothetical protein